MSSQNKFLICSFILSWTHILYANGNSFTGIIPSEITSLVNLREIYLDTNNMKGQLDSNLGDLLRLGKI